MGKLLFLLAVIAVVYWLLRSYRNSLSRDNPSQTTSEDMVRCARCGVHLPKSESILAGGEFYCSEAHRREHTSK